MTTSNRRLLLVTAYGGFTLIVWGLFAPDRGLFRDELWMFNRITEAPGALSRLFLVDFGTPTRVLTALPWTLAYWSGYPAITAQALHGVTWLACGLLSHLLVRVLMPGSPFLAFLAGSLTLTATGDFGTNYLGALSHPAVALFQGAVICNVVWVTSERGAGWLVSSVLLLQGSVWSGDNAQFAAALTPAFLWAAADFRVSRRLVRASAAWILALVPYALVFAWSWFSPSAYVHSVTEQGPRGVELVGRFWRLFSLNFQPWNWADLFHRPELMIPAELTPAPLRLVLVAVGLAAFAVVGWRYSRSDEQDPTPRTENLRRMVSLAAASVLIAAVANLNYAPLGDSIVVHRTQLVSRVFSSIAVALLSAIPALAVTSRSWMALVCCGPFVGLGLWTGIVSQDFYLAMWRRHVVEVRSIVEQAPGFHEQAVILLYVPPDPPYLAMASPFGAGHWFQFVYGDPTLRSRIQLWNSANPCVPGPEAMSCRNNGRTCALPYERLVAFIYDSTRNRFVLQDRLPAAWAVDVAASGRYRPRSLIVARPLPERARRVIYAQPWLSRWLPRREMPTIEAFTVLRNALGGELILDPEVRLPWDYHAAGQRLALWLGEGVAEGYGGAIWAKGPGSLRFVARIRPGPGRTDQRRTIRLDVEGAGGIRSAVQEASSETDVGFTLAVDRGRNMFRLTVVEPAQIRIHPNGDRRALLAFARGVDISPVSSCRASLGSGWSHGESDRDGWFRWTARGGEVDVEADRAMDVALDGRVLSAPRPNNLRIVLNGRLVLLQDIGWEDWGFRSFGSVHLALRAGHNLLRFEGDHPPIRLAGDARELSVAVGSLRLRQTGGPVPCDQSFE